MTVELLTDAARLPEYPVGDRPVYQTRSWIRAMSSSLDGASFLVASDWIFVLSWVRDPSARWNNPRRELAAAAGNSPDVVHSVLTEALYPIAICCSPHGARSGAFAIGPGERGAFEQGVDELERIARDAGSGATAFLYLHAGERYRSWLEERGYRVFRIEPTHVLSLEGCASFDDYLARLRVDDRSRVRRELRRFTEAGGSVGVEPPTAALLDEMVELDLALSAKYGVAMTRSQRLAYHRRLDETGFVTRHYIGRAGGELLGYTTVVITNRRWFGRSSAYRDRGDSKSVGYSAFAITYYQPTMDAIAEGALSYEVGRGTDVAKRARGFADVDLHLALRVPALPAAVLDALAALT